MFSRKVYKNIIVTKPLVEVDGEKLGYLPGNVDEKTEPYMMSIYYNMEQIIGKRRLEILRQVGDITVIPLAYMRGLTINDSIVILDEAQNASPIQMKMFLTRLGIESKAVITGDISQIDLPKKTNSGLVEVLRILKNIKSIGIIKLDESDVTRHEIVKDIINAYSKLKK